jgi:aflatoxin B1 aldehyde reductase
MGTSEQYLGDVDWQKRGIIMETKLYPTASRDMSKISSEKYSHNAEDVRAGLMTSLKALKADKIEMFYLHGPDRTVPFEITLAEVNKLHKEGYFRRFGISNFQSWEVAKICEICDKNGWIKPTAYQGIYNALHRGIEAELIPCLRHYGISLYAFQPLAGGFLTGKFTKDTTEFEEGSRFDPKRWQGKLHQGRYWNDEYFAAMSIIKAATDKHSLTVAEAALRWNEHHSLMSVESGDSLIIGASSAKQLEANLVDLEKGPLPDDVVEAFNEGWKIVKGRVPNYWH